MKGEEARGLRQRRQLELRDHVIARVEQHEVVLVVALQVPEDHLGRLVAFHREGGGIERIGLAECLDRFRRPALLGGDGLAHDDNARRRPPRRLHHDLGAAARAASEGDNREQELSHR